MTGATYHRLVVALVFVAACAPSPTPPPPPGQAAAGIRAAIDSQFAKLFDAYRQRDGAAFAAVYTDDGVMTSPGGSLTSRSAIQADMQSGLANVAGVTNDTVTTEDFLASDDRALQTGHYVWTETSKKGQTRKYRMTFAFTWRKDADGIWRIARDIDFEALVK